MRSAIAPTSWIGTSKARKPAPKSPAAAARAPWSSPFLRAISASRSPMTSIGKPAGHAAIAAALLMGNAAFAAAPVLPVRFNDTPDELIARESQAYQRISLPAPSNVILEVSGILPIAD